MTFKKDLIYLFGRSGIDNGLVTSTPPNAETGSPAKASFPGLKKGRPRGNTASVVVFQYGKCQLIKFGDKRHSGIDIEQVVVGDFFSMQLLKHLVELTKEESFLMGIFTVTQRFGIVAGSPECRIIASVEIC